MSDHVVHVVHVDDGDKARWLAEFERLTGITIEQAAALTRPCGCHFDTPRHLDEDWFREQVRHLLYLVPGAKELSRETARRRYLEEDET